MASPRPDPAAVGLVVDDALERLEHQLAVGGPDARAVVDDADVDAAAPVDEDVAGAHPHRRAGGRVAHGVADEVGERPLEQRRVGDARRAASSGTSTTTSRPSAPRLATAPTHDLLDADRAQLDGQRRRLQAAHVEQVGDDVGEPVGLLLDRRLELLDGLAAATRCRAGGGWRSTP